MYDGIRPIELNVADQIRSALNGYAQSYEVSSIRSEVGSLEFALREARAEADGLRSQLQDVAQGVAALTDVVNALMDRLTVLEASQR